MKLRHSQHRLRHYTTFDKVVAFLCVMLLACTDSMIAQAQQEQASAVAAETSTLTSDQLGSLVAPIALYPDPLLAQVLAASTYPLEIVQLQQWLAKHKDLKDKALVDAVQRENWDPSVQAMAALPDVVKQLADNIKWTSELGNAFLAQESDVMNAVQRLRAEAQSAGKLKSNEQMKVETKVIESKSVVVIEQANPQVIYVPSYNPTVVWGAPAYPYPPMYYPPAGYYAAGMAISFGVGIAMGAAWGGGWGWNTGWGSNNTVIVNRNNNFNSNNINRNGGRTNIGSGNSWQHNPEHRGGAPYSDRATANKFGGTARGDSLATRQSNARQGQFDRQQPGGAGGDRIGNRQGQSGAGSRGSGGLGGASGPVGARQQPGGAGGDRIGNRQVPSGGSSRDSSAFSGAGNRPAGNAARASGQRGASSMGGSRGGGARMGGGGRRR
jgi:Protein of unknown function (DUF3300)